MAQKKKIRLSDIAEKLNISTVTVSKALSDKEGVGDDLREKIKIIAEEMGYHTKKEKHSNLSENTTGNIGILIPSRFFSPNSSYYWYIFTFLSTELLKNNYYSIMELLSDEDEKNLVLPRMLQDNKIDGLIILGQTNDSYIEKINSSFENFILLDFYSTKHNYDSVSNDDYYCSYMMTKYVISKGHREISFVGNFGATTSISDRFMGFNKAMLENGLETKLSEIINDRDDKGSKVDFLFPAGRMPTAFVCNCDETAARLITNLEQMGYKIPEDIAVTGFDNYLPNEKPDVEITTVYIKPEDTAKTAADLIIKKITNQPYIKGRHLISGIVLPKASV